MTDSPVIEATRLEARFACVRGRTQLRRCFATAPLKIAKTFPGEDALGVCLMDASPGLLAGDRYELSWHLEENARTSVTTQGFTRVHPSRDNPCLLRQEIHIADGAFLDYFPEPLMLYRDAALRSECDVHIAPNGTLLLSEIICPGRLARGEEFSFHRLESRLRVHYGGELILANHTGLHPTRFNPRRIGAWHNFTHTGSFYLFAPHIDGKLRDTLRTVLAEKTGAESARPVWGGVSLLERNGLAVNLMGHRAYDLQMAVQRLREVCRFVQPDPNRNDYTPAMRTPITGE